MITKNYIIPSDNWEQQQDGCKFSMTKNYIIPSDNWEQQLEELRDTVALHYIIPSDNWEQQRPLVITAVKKIISYQAITGNNN